MCCCCCCCCGCLLVSARLLSLRTLWATKINNYQCPAGTTGRSLGPDNQPGWMMKEGAAGGGGGGGAFCKSHAEHAKRCAQIRSKNSYSYRRASKPATTNTIVAAKPSCCCCCLRAWPTIKQTALLWLNGSCCARTGANEPPLGQTNSKSPDKALKAPSLGAQLISCAGRLGGAKHLIHVARGVKS